MKNSLFLLFYIILISIVTSNLFAKVFKSYSSDVYTGQAYGKINHYMAVKDTCDFFVFGSSRASHHINPTLLTSKSYNMGMDGRKFFCNEALFYLIPDSSMVLFHIDPSEFYDDAKSMDRLLPHYGKYEILDKALIKQDKINFIERIFGSIRFNNTFLPIIGNKFLPSYKTGDYHGFDPIYLSKMDSLYFIREEFLNDEKLSIIKEPVNQEVIAGLARIKEYSLSAGITCVFFTSPLLKGLDSRDRVFMDSTFSELELIYLDYSNEMIGTEFKYWKDEIHLSHLGAEAFSSKILTDMTTPPKSPLTEPKLKPIFH